LWVEIVNRATIIAGMADQPPAPTEADVLGWCAAGVWFPADLPTPVRPAVDAMVWRLRQAGRIEVADWVRGRGQGFRLAAPADDPGTVDLATTPPPADRAELTREAFLAPGPAVVTPVLLVACAVWFAVGIAAVWRHGEPIGSAVREMPTDGLVRLGAGFGPRLYAGEAWRLLTANVVHTSGLHVIGNLFALALLGPVAEWLWGRGRFALLLLTSGAAATAASVALHPLAVVCGASGAVWGVLFALVAWLVRYRDHLPAAVRAEWGRRLTLVVGVNALVSLLPGTAWEGHLAGGVFGVLAGGLLDRTRMAGRRRMALGLLGLACLPAVAAGLFLGMAWHSPDWQAVRDSADPARYEAEVRELLGRIDPAACQDAAAALPDRRPAADLRKAASAALRKVPDRGGPATRFRAYAAAVGLLADELLDPAPDPDGVAARKRQVAKRWKAMRDGK
jgi:membrane associated rhomboid family serine protease